MNHLFQTDQSRVLLYLDENAGWLKVITNHSDEIPVLEKILSDKESGIENMAEEKKHFRHQLRHQQEQMKQLNSELSEQQQRLETDVEKHSLYDINALLSQDILRDKIKDVEQRYLELKCSFMKFLSGII